MNQERLHQVVRRPVISEKSTIAADSMHQVIFEVLDDATKSEIKQAIEALFDVTVQRVRVVNVRGKIKRFGRTPGMRKNWKNAYVRLAEGDAIDFLGSGA